MPSILEDKLRPQRIRRIFGAYWLGVAVAGLLLPSGAYPMFATPLISLYSEFIPTVRYVASNSFDRNFIEALVATSLSWSLILSLVVVAVVFTRNSFSFPAARDKAISIALNVSALLPSWLVPFVLSQGEYSLAGGRTSALLLAATSSRLGAALVLGCFFGFVQLIFFATTLVCVVAPIRPIATTKAITAGRD